MIKYIAGLFTLLFLFSITALAQIEPPKLRPVTPTEQQRNLIAEGVTLHDKGDYDGAISKYKEVLKENEDCVEAMFELAYSYSARNEHKLSLETAMKGAKYGSRLLAGFYETIGNALDSTGDTKKAIEYYKAGVALSTKNTLLYFNIALAYRNLGDVNEYKSNLKRSVVSVPQHPSSQIALGEYYYKSGYKTPAILALARFLILEPKSSRSGTAYKEFQDLLGAGVSQGKDSNTINIIVNTNQKKDEGDFGGMDMILGLSKAGSLGEAGKGKTLMENFVHQMETYFAVMSETAGKKTDKSFVRDYYSPYFTEMKKQKFVEAFCYYVSQKSDDADVPKWLAANQAKVHEFLTWSENFTWPTVEP